MSGLLKARMIFFAKLHPSASSKIPVVKLREAYHCFSFPNQKSYIRLGEKLVISKIDKE